MKSKVFRTGDYRGIFTSISGLGRSNRSKEATEAKGIAIGQQQARSLVLRQLARRIGIFPVDIRSQVEHLSITRLDELGEALLDFGQLTDLTTWLDEHR